MPQYTNNGSYLNLLNSIMQQGSGAGWDRPRTEGVLNDQVQQFASMYKNMTGQDPSDGVINDFYTNMGQQILRSPTGEAGSNYSSNQDLFNPYIQNTYGDQIKQYQQGQQTDQLNKSQGLVQNLINKTMENTAGELGDPNSHIYQAMAGGMNNLGITPSSGAFQAGAGSTIANSGMNAANAGLSAVGLPQIAGIANTANAPYQMSMANMYPGLSSYGQGQTNMRDFDMQAELGKMLAEQSGMSGMQSAMGMTSSMLGGAGSAAGGGAAAYKATSYICLAMIERGLLQQYQLDELHCHIMPALFKKGRAFWNYAKKGQALVAAANAAGIDWKEWVHPFYDRVMAEPDSIKAVDLYAEATKELCLRVAPHLWDERVLRCSLTDSLPFVPLLFTFRPFLETVRKVLRMRMLFLYDLPRSGVSQ